MKNHIDIVCVFMKAFIKKMSAYKTGFKSEHQDICSFLVLFNFIDKVKNESKENGIFKYNRVLQLALKILHKSWKACLESRSQTMWSNHVQFRSRVMATLGDIQERFPANATFTASLIKLNTLAARWFLADGDSFEKTEEQLGIVSSNLLKYVYSDQKEQVRVAATKSLASLIPVVMARPLNQNIFFQSAANYDSYLNLMRAFVFILTDENPEIRLFILSQGLNSLFDMPLTLNSPLLAGTSILDCNELVTIQNLFSSLTI